MTDVITLVKGSYTVTIDAIQVTENYSNKLFIITPPQTKQNQASGVKDNKAVDLLRITHEIIIRGALAPTATKSSDDVRSDLIRILQGAGVSGTPIVVTYSSHPDSPMNMFMEKCMIQENPIDSDPAVGDTDLSKYIVQITLIEAVSA